MGVLRKYLDILTKVGTDPTIPRISQREVILCNKVSLLLIPIALLAMGISYYRDAIPALLSFLLFFIILISTFVLNYFKKVIVSQLLLSIVPPLALLFPFVYSALRPDINYHSFSYTFIGLAIIPLILFYRKSSMTFLFVCLFIHIASLLSFNILTDRLDNDFVINLVPQLVFWVIMVGAFLFLRREGLFIEQHLKNSNEELLKSNEAVSMQKEEIASQNEFLNKNQIKIEEQTATLANRNNELTNTKVELLKMIDKLQDAKDKLLQKEAEAKSIFDALNEHYLVAQYDLSGNPVSFNGRIVELFGSLQKASLDKLKPMLNGNNTENQSLGYWSFKKIWCQIVKGKSFTLDIEIPFRDSIKFFSTTLAPLFDSNGRTHRILAIGQDISELMEKNDKIDKINDELKEKISEISQQNDLLNHQQKEIFLKNEALKRQSEEILTINESLEERVKERTHVLETKNKQLAEYAFINSHVLRAPVSTMLGLVNLISYSALSQEDQKIYEHLVDTAGVLDNIVFRINSAIDDGFHFDRNYLEPEREFQPMK